MNTMLAIALALCTQVKYPARPAQGEFILDDAKLLTNDDASQVRKICGEVLAAKRAPIVIVTIKSLADYGASGWPIQRYAMNLFSEWAVGTSDWNYGMLLLVSSGDKKIRIELGASWGHLKDADAQKVMTEEIVPRFKRGDFSSGIVAGVKGLRGIATAEIKGEPTPQVYGPAPAKTKYAPAPTFAPPADDPPPYQRTRSNWIPDTSSSFGGWVGIVIVIVVALVVVMIVVSVIKGMGTSSWGSASAGGSPGCSAFSGGCLGSGLGSWFGGGGGYGGYGGYGRYGYYNDPWDRPWGWGGGGGWFGGGSSSRVDHYYHSDSSSSSSSGSSDSGGSSWGSSDSSSSGGGFSGGGGASGEW
jgi:uncharacterized membrane protein YgcG